MSLAPCPNCHRHVKSRDPRCPFCGTAMQPASTGGSPAAAAVLIGISLAMTGCSSSSDTPTPTQDSAADSTPMVDAAYGPPPDTGTPDSTVDTGDSGPVAAYGPPPDTGTPDSATTDAKADTTTDSLPAGAYGPPPDTGAG